MTNEDDVLTPTEELRERVITNSGLDEMYDSASTYTAAHSFLYYATYAGIVDQKYYQSANIFDLMIDGMESFLELADTLVSCDE